MVSRRRLGVSSMLSDRSNPVREPCTRKRRPVYLFSSMTCSPRCITHVRVGQAAACMGRPPRALSRPRIAKSDSHSGYAEPVMGPTLHLGKMVGRCRRRERLKSARAHYLANNGVKAPRQNVRQLVQGVGEVGFTHAFGTRRCIECGSWPASHHPFPGAISRQ